MKGKVSISLDVEVLQLLDIQAKVDGRSRSGQLGWLVRQYQQGMGEAPLPPNELSVIEPRPALEEVKGALERKAEIEDRA